MLVQAPEEYKLAPVQAQEECNQVLVQAPEECKLVQVRVLEEYNQVQAPEQENRRRRMNQPVPMQRMRKL